MFSTINKFENKKNRSYVGVSRVQTFTDRRHRGIPDTTQNVGKKFIRAYVIVIYARFKIKLFVFVFVTEIPIIKQIINSYKN